MDDMEIFRKLAQCDDKEQMQRVIDEYNIKQKTITNADRIRAMSDEELAEFISDVSHTCQDAYCGDHCPICSYTWCSFERTMEWLKRPAEVK